MTRWTVHFLWAGLLVSIVALSRAETSTSSTSSDDEKAKPDFPAQMKIGVIDLKRVFEANGQFEEKMQAMKAKVKAAEAKMRRQQEEIKRFTFQAKNDSMPADELTKLEKKIVERQSLLQAEVAIQKRDFEQQEAEVFADMTDIIDRHIAKYSKQHALHMVLRINADAPNRANRNEIMTALNKSVYYFDPKLDITAEIIKALNED